MHFPWLYEPQLVDLSDLVAEMEKKYGKAISSAAETANVRGVWRAVPQYHAMFTPAYREDLFKKAGLRVPDTWEDLYVVGKSFGGRDIWQMTLTNKKTGKDTDKPAAFIEGGRHSGEISGTESTTRSGISRMVLALTRGRAASWQRMIGR